jgi:hypothetical protein
VAIHGIKHFIAFLASCWLALQAAFCAEELLIYPAVPGLPASEHYQVRVRKAGHGAGWQDAFAWQTKSGAPANTEDAYFDHLAGWTHTYVNFESSGPVDVEIARTDGRPIRHGAVHPRRKASACRIEEGRILVRLDQPCLVAVDVDGQMDDQDTGKGYKGPPVHTISIFANPPLRDKPRPGNPGVHAVKPGETAPQDGTWNTLIFLPGIHDIGPAFPVRANCNYYIPGDALVYGTFSNASWSDGHHIRIFGHGTLSGARLRHPKHVQPSVAEKDWRRYRPVDVMGACDTQVDGITIADSAYHSLMLVHPYKPGHPNTVKWTKILTWRANGDGINPFGNTLVEDCFLRTQDDSLYASGLGIRRCVLWNDANGSSFVLSSLPELSERQLLIEDCDVIYSRAMWHHWSGGRVFNMRGEGGGSVGKGVIFRNIHIEDPRPTLQQFFICMAMPTSYSKDQQHRRTGDLAGVRFQNISIAAPSVLNEPQILWGNADARIRDLVFENLTLGDKPILSSTFFQANEFVSDLNFTPKSETNSKKQNP